MKRRVATERIVIPARPVRQFSAEAADDLQRSIRSIEAWMGKAFPVGSRPHAALEVLRDVSQTAKFTREQRGDDSGVRALQLALDLREIADSLPDRRVADLRKDLEVCASGPLDPPETALQPLQAQSQLIVRAAYSRVGAAPSQPTHSGSSGRKKPDILLENGVSEYGVEIKRPTTLKNVVPRALDAADQLRVAGVSGGIAIDITDCVDVSPQAADDEVLRQAEAVAAKFFIHGRGWTPGFSHVLMVTVLARPTWQVQMTGTADGQVLIHSTSAGQAFGTARGTLNDLRARWLRDSLSKGLNLLGFTSTEGYVAPE